MLEVKGWSQCCHNLTSPLTFGSTWGWGCMCACVCVRAVIRAGSSLYVGLFSSVQTWGDVLYFRVIVRFINILSTLNYWKGPIWSIFAASQRFWEAATLIFYLTETKFSFFLRKWSIHLNIFNHFVEAKWYCFHKQFEKFWSRFNDDIRDFAILLNWCLDEAHSSSS